MSKFGEWELVVIWESDETDIYEYETREEAERGMTQMKMALGNQIEWCGVRPA